MGSLALKNITKSFGKVEVIKGIDLEVEDGEFVIFVGPSGCGKSTLLRIIAGLEDASDGTIEIDGAGVTATPPSKRGIAMVFQTYALYPHLTVRDNMSLGLKQAKRPPAQIAERVDVATKMLSLEPYLERRPAELSGGQRQRVAIGRAVVRKPKLFLFDEPLSNLDAALRVNTRLEIARLHRELGATMIYVTHDQTEAMTLADRIVVLNGGRIEQIGTPMELYNNPANLFVAGFIGSPQMNFIDAGDLGREDARTIGIRPEHIAVGSEKGDIAGRVSHVEHLGADTNVYLDCGEAGLICVRLFGEHQFEIDSMLNARFDPSRIYRFDGEGKAIR
ncbi:ABC transporter [Nitratireductor indicus C115]|uniref:ABC transporter n=1 Tax=Nitratireductor indicus C115 TaxID=1231190 RepID=K2NT42_9HYPH|nr:ABC transporter ATP-binding protein [Nitratireductor indicus]EKF42495.1 ABC transporter [Nitratireductor indicus C115]SFQ56602.1 multiple sugar transport system ATP-binding protein [Nitratireductor indicus]